MPLGWHILLPVGRAGGLSPVKRAWLGLGLGSGLGSGSLLGLGLGLGVEVRVGLS